eukprot:gene33838-52351_t
MGEGMGRAPLGSCVWWRHLSPSRSCGEEIAGPLLSDEALREGAHFRVGLRARRRRRHAALAGGRPPQLTARALGRESSSGSECGDESTVSDAGSSGSGAAVGGDGSDRGSSDGGSVALRAYWWAKETAADSPGSYQPKTAIADLSRRVAGRRGASRQRRGS